MKSQIHTIRSNLCCHLETQPKFSFIPLLLAYIIFVPFPKHSIFLNYDGRSREDMISKYATKRKATWIIIASIAFFFTKAQIQFNRYDNLPEVRNLCLVELGASFAKELSRPWFHPKNKRSGTREKKANKLKIDLFPGPTDRTSVQLHIFLDFATYDNKVTDLSNSVPRKWRTPNTFIVDNTIQKVKYKPNWVL